MGKYQNAPLLYEINTAVWLHELGQRYEQEITLANVPDEVVAQLADYGVNTVWLMGVWQRSPRAVAIGRADEGLQAAMQAVLPDFRDEDFLGSPYAVHNYQVHGLFGGEKGLRQFRAQLRAHTIDLMLDFVPNHTAPDHPWIQEHPEYYIRGTAGDLADEPASFIECDGGVFANGRDPQYPAWGDVVQLNAFAPGYRQAAIDTLRRIAGLCDGVRCDMAMLLMNNIFQANWSEHAGDAPAKDFWEHVIPAARAHSPDFIFLAETYWDTEQALLDQGFDYCYDKTLYDLLRGPSAEAVNAYVGKTAGYRRQLVQFIENHDEPRAASEFAAPKEKAAAAVASMLPGPWLFYDGQLQGSTVKLPVHLGRGPAETVNADLQSFYEKLLAVRQAWQLGSGRWRLLLHGHPQLIAYEWQASEQHYALVNYGNFPVHAQLPELASTQLFDNVTGKRLSGDDIVLDPWRVYLLTREA